MTNVGHASNNLHMMKIKQCCDLLGVSMYRVALQMRLPRKKNETDAQYDKRRRRLVWARHVRGWEMSYSDKKVSMRPHVDAEIKTCECDLDDFVENA